MGMNRKLRILCVLLITLPATLWAATKVEILGAFADPSAPDAVRNALAPTGYRVILPNGLVAAEVWFAKSLTTSAKQSAGGTNYAQLAPSTFIGVISFPKAGSDFRGQGIKAGAYVMRYELLPNDGNHLGVAPNRDFVLLTPLASDKDPASNFAFEQLVALSREASGSSHPAAFYMPTATGSEFPNASMTDDGWYVLNAKAKTAAGEMPLALVVKGASQ